MGNKSLLSGPKFNSRHQTYLNSAVPLLTELKQSGTVKKIFLGQITRIKAGVPSVKIVSIDEHLVKLLFRGRLAKQVFRVVSNDVKLTKDIIEKYSKAKKKMKPTQTKRA